MRSIKFLCLVCLLLALAAGCRSSAGPLQRHDLLTSAGRPLSGNDKSAAHDAPRYSRLTARSPQRREPARPSAVRPAAAEEAPIVEEAVAVPRAMARQAATTPPSKSDPTPRRVPAPGARAGFKPEPSIDSAPARPVAFDPAPQAEFDPAPPADRAVPRRGPQPGAVMAQAADYSWVQGVLEHSAVDNGAWKVRYAPISVDDENGGSFILDAPRADEAVRPGDVVYVEGEVLADAGHRRMATGARYRVERLALVDHGAALEGSSAASSAMK